MSSHSPNKKIFFNAPEDQMVFENTHPAIIDQETFDRVQHLRENKRRPTKSGRIELFAGFVCCKDCGSKLYFSSGASITKEQDNYACSGFRSKKVECNGSHYIRAVMLEKMVSEYLERVKDFVIHHENAFVSHVTQGVSTLDGFSVKSPKIKNRTAIA